MKQKVLIKTYGCSFNQSDSEIMAGHLISSGLFEMVGTEDLADIVIINSCTVKNKAETKFWRDVKKIKKPKVLAGCVPQASKDKTRFIGYSVIGTDQINNIVEVAKQTLEGQIVQLHTKQKIQRLNIPKLRKNPVIEILPINEGCLGSCNFCITKFARGHLRSYSPDAIVQHIRSALNDGVKEIWLTSQDTACYGYDIQTNLAELLKKILRLDRDFRIRIGMGNPDFFSDYLDELIKVYHDKRIFKFLHIPVQSGSDKVLKDMKRNYSTDQFRHIIKKFRSVHPQLTVSTDIICGYPTESDADFMRTQKFVDELKFDVINISRFWPRPGTVAAKLKQLPSNAIKSRGAKLTEQYHRLALQSNKKWLGWTGEILIDEIGKPEGYIGRNFAYKPVLTKNTNLGISLKVNIQGATTFDLRTNL